MYLSAQGRGDNLSEWGTSGVIVDLKAAREMLTFSRDEKKGGSGTHHDYGERWAFSIFFLVCLFVCLFV